MTDPDAARRDLNRALARDIAERLTSPPRDDERIDVTAEIEAPTFSAEWSDRKTAHEQAVERADKSRGKQIGIVYCAACPTPRRGHGQRPVATFTETGEGLLYEAEVFNKSANDLALDWSQAAAKQQGLRLPWATSSVVLLVDWPGALEGWDPVHLDASCRRHPNVRADRHDALAQYKRYRARGKPMTVRAAPVEPV